jgi:hypothetical protein
MYDVHPGRGSPQRADDGVPVTKSGQSQRVDRPHPAAWVSGRDRRGRRGSDLDGVTACGQMVRQRLDVSRDAAGRVGHHEKDA